MAGRCVYIGRQKKGGNPYEETCICSSDDVAALDDGSMDKFIADATELAAGQTYEGTLDENGAVPEADAADDAE